MVPAADAYTWDNSVYLIQQNQYQSQHKLPIQTKY